MKKVVSLVLALAMVMSLAISSAAAVEISDGPVEVIVDGTTIVIGGEQPSVMPRYTGYTLLNVTKNANEDLDTTFRCRSAYGNKCDVTLQNNGTSDLLVEMMDGQYAQVVSPETTEVIPIETTDGSALQVTVDIQVQAFGNPSGTYTVTAVQYQT